MSWGASLDKWTQADSRLNSLERIERERREKEFKLERQLLALSQAIAAIKAELELIKDSIRDLEEEELEVKDDYKTHDS